MRVFAVREAFVDHVERGGMSRIVVPEGMLKAAEDVLHGKAWEATSSEGRQDTAMFTLSEAQDIAAPMLATALHWLSEHPVVPCDGESRRIWEETGLCNDIGDGELRAIVIERQRRMFLAPEPEVPEALKDLLWAKHAGTRVNYDKATFVDQHNEGLIEAYRRGRESK